MDIHFHRLRYFIAVAETLNFTKAAQNMFVSPQALNQQIIKLEEELGCALFFRSTRTVQLTEAGERLYTNFSSVIKQYETGCMEFEAWQKKQKSVLKIGYLEVLSTEDIIKPIIRYLQNLDANIRVQIRAGQLNEVNRWMQEGSIDLCITNVHENEMWCDAFERITLFQMPAVIVTGKEHPWTQKEVITKEDMKQYPILLMKQPKDMERDNFYSKIKGSENVYYPNYDSILMNMETGPYYSVFPKLPDCKNGPDKLNYYELPKEYRFLFYMCLLYREDNRFSNLFRKVRLEAKELHIKI